MMEGERMIDVIMHLIQMIILLILQMTIPQFKSERTVVVFIIIFYLCDFLNRMKFVIVFFELFSKWLIFFQIFLKFEIINFMRVFRKNNAMWADNNERKINYDWPDQIF